MSRSRTDTDATGAVPRPVAATPGLLLVEPRAVPLGGLRSMTVRRTLPQRGRSLVGAWCFLDHFGPDDVAETGGMDVPPHPHTGLQTVTWLFDGAIEHRDSVGSLVTVRPGQLNLMTAGRGVSHSERTPPPPELHAARLGLDDVDDTIDLGTRFEPRRSRRAEMLHGVQLWTALPDAHRHRDATFEHVPDVPTVDLGDARVQVFVGELLGVVSPATVFSPLVGAQLDLGPGARVDLPLEPGWEYALLVDDGDIHLEASGRSIEVPRAHLGLVDPGHAGLTVRSAGGARAVLIGGAPFDEQILMWWNFVGRTHEEVVEARAEWQASLVDGAPAGRFGRVEGYPAPDLPAPELPNVRLRPRD